MIKSASAQSDMTISSPGTNSADMRSCQGDDFDDEEEEDDDDERAAPNSVIEATRLVN